MTRMMRADYDRIGERRFDVEAHIPVGRGYIVLDHPGVDMLQMGSEVAFAVEGDVPLGGHELNVPGVGKLIGTVRSADEGPTDERFFDAILVPPGGSEIADSAPTS